MDKGLLVLKENKGNKYGESKIEYGIDAKLEFIDLTDIFNSSLMDKVEILILIQHALYVSKGELLYKLVNGILQLHVGDTNIDEILWNNVGQQIELKMTVVKECEK
ncbi:hypothetical protein [Clostridium tagluense]|uniref:Uncharacterized protein n=1 Tax=Clostridium tagluense TaxID=360422 RepID=A0A401ULK8_9CLOT|nr:hypothetical protein [Clostridium tagluense]GCD10409.1 hypothetical protein Ctaglu_20320 [Clostridium tagluense]